MQLTGALEDRDAWTAHGSCPIEKAMEIVGSRNAMLILREAFYGTTRYEDFGHRVGMSEATTAANLKALVSAGLLTKTPYQVAGQRRRYEYVLTDAGRDLMPVVIGLFAWGMKHADAPPPLALSHHDCESPVGVQIVCGEGHRVGEDEIEMRVTPRRRRAQ